MKKFLFQVLRSLLPDHLKGYLRRQGLLFLEGRVAWELPAPLGGYRMQGPGVFGTYVAESYEPEVSHILLRTVAPGQRVADVGAHLGYFTLLLSYAVGESGRVYSFEAFPENVKWLKKNVDINGLNRRVVVIDKAVAGRGVTNAFLCIPKHYTNECSIASFVNQRRSISVPATWLDEYFSSESVDFIKMDIEGAEYVALEGAADLLKRCHPTLLIELHGQEGKKAAELLWELGYYLEDLKGGKILETSSVLPRHVLARPG